MDKQQTALRLADALETYGPRPWSNTAHLAAAELRRLHALNQELLEALKSTGRPAEPRVDMTAALSEARALLDKNSMAMAQLFKGEAAKPDMDTLIAMHNICEALWQMGKGKEYTDVLAHGKAALLDVCNRGAASKRFVLRAPEMQALKDLMELHDAQMETSTIRDLEKARRTTSKPPAA